MAKGYKKVDTAEVSNAARMKRSQKRETKRIKYDRFRLAVVIALILVIALCAVVFSMCIIQLIDVIGFKNKASVGFRLSKVLAALLNETTASVKYVNTIDLDIPPRRLEAYIEQFQLATREAFTEASNGNNDCDICPDVLGLVNLEALLYAQRNVIRRSYTPLSCLLAYRSVIQTLSNAMNYFLGFTLRKGVVDIVWLQNILLGVRSVGMIIPGIMYADISQDLLQSMYYDVSTCVSSLENVDSNSYSLEANKLEWKTNYQAAVNPPYTGGEAVLDQIDVDLTGVKVVADKYSVDETLDEIVTTYVKLLARLETEEPWKKYSISLEIVTLVTTLLVIVLSCVGIALIVYSALSIIWVSPESLYGMRHQERVESSLARMDYFVDRVYDLDLEGVTESAQRSVESKSITSAERDLLRLAPKLIQVLAFINPNVYSFRQHFMEQNGEDIVNIEMDEDEPINPLQTRQALQSSEVVPHRGESSQAASSVIISQGGNYGGAVISQTAALTAFTETKLVLQSVCFLLVDISCFFEEVTPETSKVVPNDIAHFMSVLLKLVKASGGSYIATAGSIVITAFNEAEVLDAENTCVMVLFSMQQHIINLYPQIRCAVISSVVPQGIIGSPSLKTYVTDGDVLHQGGLLIRVARLHNATFVVDTVTFMKIDTQHFYKLALEQVGFDETELQNTTTVYELVPHGRETSSYLWNEAFDQFHAGEYEHAREKLKVWRQHHGATQSWKRFNALLNASPRPRPVTFLYATGDNFEPEFFLY